MRHLLCLMVMASSLALTACGGSSDSSGSGPAKTPDNSNVNTGGQQAKLYNTATDNACTINTTTNEVYATTSGCNFAHPSLNAGAALTYTCVANGRVNGMQGGLNLTAKTLTLTLNNQSVTVLCSKA